MLRLSLVRCAGMRGAEYEPVILDEEKAIEIHEL